MPPNLLVRRSRPVSIEELDDTSASYHGFERDGASPRAAPESRGWNRHAFPISFGCTTPPPGIGTRESIAASTGVLTSGCSTNWKHRTGWQRSRPLRVLDCGIGAGLLTASLIAAVSRSFDLYGIDTSTKMLKRARSRLVSSGANATLVIADACSLPFRDCEMDLVMAALVLEHIPAPPDALREMARVARPKATLLFVTTRPHAPDILFRLEFRYRPLRKSQLLRWMADAGIRAICSAPLSGFARAFARAYVGTKLE